MAGRLSARDNMQPRRNPESIRGDHALKGKQMPRKHEAGYRLQRNENGEPLVDQGSVNGHEMSWNPDDSRFYVHGEHGKVLAMFKEWRNAVYYAKTH